MAWNVVIVGGGFGGVSVARHLEKTLPRQSARLTLVNDVNFSLYTPFLPEAAAGTLEPRHVVTPLRDVLKRTYLRLGAATAHDPAARTITLREHDGDVEQLRYDQLLLSVGSVSRVLPVPGLAEHAIGFKSLGDAIWLRNHVVQMLEHANSAEDPVERERLLTFVFVGGGYAGLEALAELQDFAADAMEVYPRARLQGMRWILLEAKDRVLPEIDSKLADYAVRELRSRGIEVRLGTTIDSIEAQSTKLSTGEVVPTETVVWTAGVTPHPSLRNLSVPLDDKGRVIVGKDLVVQGMNGVWAIGDSAAVPMRGGGFAPPTAQHTIRAGKVAANNIAAALGNGTKRDFTYNGQAAFVNLGRYKAVGRISKFTFSGLLAWWMARTYHLTQIPGLARKVRAVIDWTVSLPFRRDVADLGSFERPRELSSEVFEYGGSHRPLRRGPDQT